MKDAAPQFDWLPYESALMSVSGIRFARPQGYPISHGDHVVIGVIRMVGGQVRVLPCLNLSAGERRKLLSAACWAVLHGPRGAHWRIQPGAGWLAEVGVRQLSGVRSASADAFRRLSSDGGKNSHSSSGCPAYSIPGWLEPAA